MNSTSEPGPFLPADPHGDGSRPETSAVAPDKTPQRDRVGYIPTLDGWRAVAILWVLNGHQKLYHVGRFSNDFLRTTGDRGVQLFFALSGLLICSRLLREEARFGNISLKSFYTRRLFRIQPPALLYLGVLMLLSLAGLIPMFWQGALGGALMIRNLWPGQYGRVYWFTSHFWSLSVEEHFYLFLPGFLVLFRRGRLAILAMLVVLLEIWRVVVLTHPRLQGFTWLIFLRTDVVLGGILLGSVFAVALDRERMLALAQRYLRPWVALLYTALVFTELHFHHSRLDHALIITTYPLLLTATLLHPETWTGWLLETAPLRFIGRISFSLYLWQQMFFNYDYPPQPGEFRSHVLLCWVLAFGCATASFYLVETPMIRVGHRLAKRFSRAA